MREGPLLDLWKNFKSILQKLVGIAALFLFLLSAGINIGTWICPATARFPYLLLWTHVAILILAAAYTFLHGNHNRSANSSAWVEVVSTALFAYMFLSMAFFVVSSAVGEPHHDLINAYNSDQKTIPLEKDSHWYSRNDLYGLRFGSIFWMIFSFQIATASLYSNFTTRFGRYDAVVKKL